MAVPGKKATKNISARYSRDSGEDFGVFCQPCDRDDRRLPATGYCVDCDEHLCDSCFKTHRRPKPLRHHKLLDIDNMPHTQNLSSMSSSTHVGQPDQLTTPCSKHTKEIIKFYCHDHKALLCSVCVTLGHIRTSCQVDYIPDISGHTIDSTEYKDTLKELDRITEECQNITTDLRQMVAKSNTSLADVLVEITKLRGEMNNRLNELEKKAKHAVETLKQENDTKLKITEETCDDLMKSFNASSDMIRQLNTTKKADILFTELKHADQLLRDNGERMMKLKSTGATNEYTFDPSQAIQTLQTLLQNEKSLGTLTPTILQPSHPSFLTLKSKKTSHHENIYIRTSSDKTDCDMTGMVIHHTADITGPVSKNNHEDRCSLNSKSIFYDLP